MDGVPAVYLGRIVSKKHFRTFVYASNGSKKLVESWEEYENHMESGLWFANKNDAINRVPVEKTKRTRKPVTVVQPVIKEDENQALSEGDF